MNCPFCATNDTKVIDSRLSRDGEQVRRRRTCTRCKERFTTYETAALNLPRVIKRDHRRESFQPEKLQSGMLRALERRPVSSEQMDEAIRHIEHRLIAGGEREVQSKVVGEEVMEALRRLDQVAYVRFASVYWNFEDMDAFRELIERLEKEPSPELRRHQMSLLPEEPK